MVLVCLGQFRPEAQTKGKIKDLVCHMVALTISPPSPFHHDKLVYAELVGCTHRPIPSHIVSYVKRENVWFLTDAQSIIISDLQEVKESLAKDLMDKNHSFLFYKFRYKDGETNKHNNLNAFLAEDFALYTSITLMICSILLLILSIERKN